MDPERDRIQNIVEIAISRATKHRRGPKRDAGKITRILLAVLRSHIGYFYKISPGIPIEKIKIGLSTDKDAQGMALPEIKLDDLEEHLQFLRRFPSKEKPFLLAERSEEKGAKGDGAPPLKYKFNLEFLDRSAESRYCLGVIIDKNAEGTSLASLAIDS
jgi:hypothetical protein